ncbi:MAG: glucose 1-dehydrogenase [Gammaproteobacteria bacterium]|nr:glucose 1-dehydrogenase [Gammaproteobacteria bacterium]
MGRLDGKVAIVTGGASNPGLGRCTAITLAAEGATLVVTDIDESGAESCASEIRDAGGEALALHQDVTSEDGWQAVVANTVEAYGKLDVLVNNAGIAVLMPVSKMSLADWNRQIEVNLTSVFLGCKYAMPEMKKAGGGSLVNLSSVAGIIGLASCVAYGAAKGGVRIMSKALAIEGAGDNIRCNSVHPGIIWTNMQAQATGSVDISEARVPPERVPLGRVGEPQDIANCVLYLASDESNYVTGAEFVIDAGMTAQ